MTSSSAAKFDPARAADYAEQSRIALAGYDACHALSACMLSAALGAGSGARVLVVGAGGTAGEIIAAARLEDRWRFVAVDPSPPMLELARDALDKEGLSARVETIEGHLERIDAHAAFDAAIMIGVLHHIPGDAAKQALLSELAARLKPGAPLVLAGNYRAYASEPLLMAAWANRWRMHGAGPDEVEARRAKILQGAEPPQSEEAVSGLLTEAGFEPPLRFFASLFWGAWFTRRA